MKIARIFSAVVGVLGAAVMVFSVILCLCSLDAEPKLKELPEGAVACAQELQQAVAKADFEAISRCLYGHPNLGAEEKMTDAAGKALWEAFEDSLSLTYEGSCYATNSGIGCNAVVTSLDVAAVAQSLSGHAHALMTQRVAQAEEMEELYDESNNFRADLVEEVLQQAMGKALENGETVKRNVTLTLVCENGQWYAVADDAFLQAISGGLK